MSKPNPITDAIGVVKLADMHYRNPTAVAAEVVRDAARECIERLESIPAEALALVTLYTALLAITPPRWLPHVTLTNDPLRPLGAVITDEAGNIAANGAAGTAEGLVELLQARLAAGRGEVWP